MAISEEQTPDNTDSRLSEWLMRLFRQARYEDADHVARLDRLETLIVELTPAGYGGALQNTDVTGFDIPTTTYITLPFDTASPLVERGVTFDLVNNEFTFTRAGVWTIMINMSIQGHNSSNGGRRFFMRFFNVTDSIGGDGFVVGVGRNKEDTNASVSFLVEVTQTDVDLPNIFRAEAGDADTAINNGTLIAAGVQVTHSSELGNLL